MLLFIQRNIRIHTAKFTQTKGLFITLLIFLLIGGIYTGIQLLLPNRGLTGYYLYFSEAESKAENVPLHPIKVSSSEILPNLKKEIYEGYPKKKLITEIIEDKPINFNWSSEAKKPYQSPFTIEWDGLLKIERRADYTFVLGSDDGSELFLNGKLIIDNGGHHGLVIKR
ncbi:MAG: PA14 domain-containing protein [Candidatus Brocadia sp.]|nr:PA14 domain-containing protein [Candidatus Brocadia sp.]